MKNENEQTDDHKNNAEPTLEEEREILERMEKENDCEERKVVLLDDDECPDDKKQTIQALSIVKVVLEPVDPDNSVKYRVSCVLFINK